MKHAASILAIALASACASPVPLPTGPGILVLPGTGKSFEQFRADDDECRDFALSDVQKGAPQTSDEAFFAATRLQQRYDRAFAQCMFARGHRIPVSGAYSDSSKSGQSAAPTPPPPPGKPPAEPPPDYPKQ